jgi:hypothetical protein
MNQEVCWYRVFGSKADVPDLSKLRAVYRLAADEHGWYQVHFPLLWGEIELNRWLPKKDRIRTELNTWAAWVEAHGEGKLDWLMQRIIATEQLFVWSIDPTAVDGAAFSELLCRFLCEATDGVYQIDGVGFIAADGNLLVAEEGA